MRDPKIGALHLPDGDFWIFDESRVAVIRFGDTGVLGAEVITDPGTVDRYRAIRQRAWAAATPFTEWARGRYPPRRA